MKTLSRTEEYEQICNEFIDDAMENEFIENLQEALSPQIGWNSRHGDIRNCIIKINGDLGNTQALAELGETLYLIVLGEVMQQVKQEALPNE